MLLEQSDMFLSKSVATNLDVSGKAKSWRVDVKTSLITTGCLNGYWDVSNSSSSPGYSDCGYAMASADFDEFV